MRQPLSIYAGAGADRRLHRCAVALVAAVAVLLAMAAPAVAAVAGADQAGSAGRGGAGFRTGQILGSLSGGSISGQVTFPAGSDEDYLAGQRTVQAYDAQGEVAGEGEADSDGSYSIEGLAAGTYHVGFARLSSYATAAAQFYDDKLESTGVLNSDPVPVTDGQDTPGIDANLHQGGHLIGHLVDAQGQALSCPLVAMPTVPGNAGRYGYSQNSNGGGVFDIGGLTEGTYFLKIEGRGNCDQGDRFLTAAGLGLDAAKVFTAATEGVSVDLGTVVYPSGTLSPRPPAPPVLKPVVPVVPEPTFGLESKQKVAGSDGVTRVGETLKVTKAVLTPAPTEIRYSWRANGEKIRGESHRKYDVDSDERGKRISVKVVYVRPGYPNYVQVTRIGRIR